MPEVVQLAFLPKCRPMYSPWQEPVSTSPSFAMKINVYEIFESQCCQLVDYVTSLGKMWTPWYLTPLKCKWVLVVPWHYGTDSSSTTLHGYVSWFLESSHQAGWSSPAREVIIKCSADKYLLAVLYKCTSLPFLFTIFLYQIIHFF